MSTPQADKTSAAITNHNDMISQSDERNRAAHGSGMSRQDMADYYSKWAATYEKDLCKGIYNGPTIAAMTLGTLYVDQREQVRILDIACGTGLLGKELYELGFRQLDGLDPAEGMLTICRTKGVYDRLICDYIGGANAVGIHSDMYDCVVISGGMGESHIPCSAFQEMARLVKQGGYICFVMRQEYTDYVTEYNNNKLEQEIANLEDKGLWETIVRKVVPNYSFGKDGIVFVFRVTKQR